MAEIWKGAPVAEALNARAIAQVEALGARGIHPTLAIIRVGERPDDLSYERGAMKRCEKLGVQVRRFLLPQQASQAQLLEAIAQVNGDPGIHGCLLLRPLPPQMDEEAARRALSPAKDVDGITDGSLAGVFTGSGEGYPPCTAQACIEILDHYGYSLQGKRAVVVGRSLVVGKPVAMLLLARHATVTICHTRTQDLPGICRGADLVIAAAGKPRMLTQAYFAPGQVVLDVGIHVLEDGSMCGDVDDEAAQQLAAAVTPVPGGVGTVTTSVLAAQVVAAAGKAVG
ncbi:MAG TPA: bifunctional 5,10-methylenetetrahydrofolate dehydrogenase/5,10-methenyltetrahydrofolate cyclohydrolase [Candidatus Anaerotruncus excrementipullorum]|uniref:Bifunctional protein FolD n=1 Tax=Candidatus Anaerotruncus excrementipullorum TaxID=2838465 RepID=A0A9D1WR91_9FIRM|nr:bifunctional 5,10-methylenetetrahydrofolate dehydrogenase/5,10-methenyltetrahydrofolate cyclohydrolase [Candidatus Anaerotruncus excrementipullorum]